MLYANRHCVIDIPNIDFFSFRFFFRFWRKTNRWPLIGPTHKTLHDVGISFRIIISMMIIFIIIFFSFKNDSRIWSVTAMATKYVQSLIRFSLFSGLQHAFDYYYDWIGLDWMCPQIFAEWVLQFASFNSSFRLLPILHRLRFHGCDVKNEYFWNSDRSKFKNPNSD